MKQSDLEGFQTLLTDALAFYRQDVSEFALSVWWQACRTFDLEQVRKAFSAHAMDAERGRFPPMPADIVKHLQGTQTDRGVMAWARCWRACSASGPTSRCALTIPPSMPQSKTWADGPWCVGRR